MRDNDLKDAFLNAEKKSSLYRSLVNHEENILKKSIPLPRIETTDDYQTKLLPWLKFWGKIDGDDNGIVVKYANKMFPVGKKACVPVSYTVRNADVVFRFLGLTKKRDIFLQRYQQIVDAFPELNEWCLKNRVRIINEDGFSDKVIEIAKYFKTGAKRDCYITQWQIPLVDTKFHHKNFEVFRTIANIILGISLANREEFYQYFGLLRRENMLPFACVGFSFKGLQFLSLPVDELAKESVPADVVVIIENKDHGAYIANRLRSSVPCLIFYGIGKAILPIKNIPWLKDREIYYSGDMDKDGFGILSEMREAFPQVKSLFMDCLAMKKTIHLAVADRLGSGVDVSFLTKDEFDCFQFLQKEGLRIEQERIDSELFLKAVSNAVNNFSGM